MTPAAIRAAKGPTLDAFVLERVCGWRFDRDEALTYARSVWREQPSCVVFTFGFAKDLSPFLADSRTEEVTWQHPFISTDNAACWRWVVPALVAKGYYFDVVHDPDVGESERWGCSIPLTEGGRYVCGFAPTPALAIVRAAALTVAEGGE